MPCCYRAAIHRIICVSATNRFVTFTRDLWIAANLFSPSVTSPRLDQHNVIRGRKIDRG